VSRPGEWLARRSGNQRLALVALLLGAGALAIGDVDSGGRVTLDTRELAAIVEGELDHVTPEELADWIVAGRADYRLIDLRAADELERYRIPGAERVAISGLLDAGLSRDERIVLYSEEGIHSAQAWMLLKAHRYPAVYILLGGLAGWQEHVLYPVEPAADAPIAERAAFARASEIARHFGGAPRTAAAAVEALPPPTGEDGIAPPRVAPPPSSKRPVRARREGC
jgi:rhodanese-related sulfurtransferase